MMIYIEHYIRVVLASYACMLHAWHRTSVCTAVTAVVLVVLMV